MSAFAIPESISLDCRSYADEYKALLKGDGGAASGVTAVDHSEFEAAVKQLRRQAGRGDDSCAALVIQRGMARPLCCTRWHLLRESTDFFGVSVAEALPRNPVETVHASCPAEQAWLAQQQAGVTERAKTHARRFAP
jgi:hypothetical protein